MKHCSNISIKRSFLTLHAFRALAILCLLSGTSILVTAQTSNLSPTTRLALHRQKQGLPPAPVPNSKSGLGALHQHQPTTSWPKAISVLVTSDFDVASLRTVGVRLNRAYPGRLSVSAKPEQITALAGLPGVRYVDVGTPARMRMDSVLKFTRADSVQAGLSLPQAYSGTDVVIGIIDFGFALRHPFFRDLNGALRVKRFWVQDDNSGTAPAAFGYGSEFTDSSAILTKNVDYPAFEQGDHGNSVACTASGSGYGMANGQYRGIAPNADLVIVSFPLDAEATAIDAVQYCVDYAQSVGKPLVLNSSWGFDYSAQDGTAIFDQYLDALALNAQPAVVMCNAVGNEGRLNQNLRVQITAPDTVRSIIASRFSYQLLNEFFGSIPVPFWGVSNEHFDVAFGLIDGAGMLAGRTEFISTQADAFLADTVFAGSDTLFFQAASQAAYPTNGQPYTLADLNYRQADGSPYALVALVSAADALVQSKVLFLNYTDTHPGTQQAISGFTAGDDNYCIAGSPGTGFHTLGAGGYVNRDSVVNIAGDLVPVGFEGDPYGAPGDHVFYSVKGPSYDGRTKPDVCAPTDGVYVLPAEDPSLLKDEVTFDGVTYEFSIGSGGTSSCAPVVAGVCALVLEANPQLTGAQVGDIIRQSAIVDSWTTSYGPMPNNTFGWGKVNAMGAVRLALSAPTSIPGVSSEADGLVIYPVPTSNLLNVRLPLEVNGLVRLTITDVTGRLLLQQQATAPTIQIGLQDLTPGLYFIRVEQAGDVLIGRFIKQ